LSDADDFDMNVALPSNLTMVDEDAELAGLHSSGADWGTGIQARKGRELVRYGSPSSWMSTGGYFGGLEQDLEGFETDDSCSEPGNEYDESDSSDLQVRVVGVVIMSYLLIYQIFTCLCLETWIRPW
jgi:hypothetical protein